MLDSMRSLANSFVAKALMILLVISFAVWGMGDVVRGSHRNYVAKVGDAAITPAAFMSEQRAMVQAMESMGIKGLDAHAIQSEVLRRMIQQRLVEQWLKDTGLQANRDSLAKYIQQSAEFKGFNNKFDPKIFAAMLRARQMHESAYLGQLSNQLGSKAILLGVDMADMQVAPSMLELAAAAGTQTRDAVLITVPASVAPAVTDKEAQDYYEQHKDDYAQPETRTLDYVTLDTKGMSDQALQDLSTQLEDALAGGSTLTEALADAKIKTQTHTLSKITAAQYASSKDSILKSVATQGFQLEQGESSNLMSTDDGHYFIVSAKEVNPAAPKKFDEVAAEVRRGVAKQKASDATHDRVQALKKQLRDGKSWSEAAAAVGAHGQAVTGVARPTILPDGTVKPSGGPVPPALQQAVFEHDVGSIAGPMARDNGDQVVALVTAIRIVPAADKSKKAAQTEYLAQLGDATTNSTFRALAARYSVNVNEEMLQQINGGPNE